MFTVFHARKIAKKIIVKNKNNARDFTRSAAPDFSFSPISYGRPRAEILVNHQINFLSPTYPAPFVCNM